MSAPGRLLIFSLQGSGFALELAEVAEIVEPPPLFPIPRVPSCFNGVMNSHGNLVPVVDLAEFFGLGAQAVGGKILVLDRQIANLAFRVENIRGIITSDLVLEEHAGDRQMVTKILQLPDGEIRRLDLAGIVGGLEKAVTGS
ncbi:MAG: chemotaxis protein CheW [Geobacter sp.]|nr:chemotaxis protein CheW [Geobacter sp.]